VLSGAARCSSNRGISFPSRERPSMPSIGFPLKSQVKAPRARLGTRLTNVDALRRAQSVPQSEPRHQLSDLSLRSERVSSKKRRCSTFGDTRPPSRLLLFE
jgi:hypothetical protein